MAHTRARTPHSLPHPVGLPLHVGRRQCAKRRRFGAFVCLCLNRFPIRPLLCGADAHCLQLPDGGRRARARSGGLGATPTDQRTQSTCGGLQAVLGTNPLLEAFGNAKTLR